MPSRQEIWSSIYGAWRILRFDPNALQHFNLTIEGFWRSFFAFVLVAPIVLVATLLSYEQLPEEARSAFDPTTIAVTQLISHVLIWIAMPVAMIGICRLLNLTHRYVTFIIIWNWANFVAASIMLVPGLILTTGLLSPGFGQIVMVLVLGYVLFYNYLVAKYGLECTTGIAIGIVVFDLVISIFIEYAISSLFQLPFS